jgi:hypothetical protein
MLFAAIPSRNITLTCLSDSVLFLRQGASYEHLTTKDSQGSCLLLSHCTVRPFNASWTSEFVVLSLDFSPRPVSASTMAPADFSRQALLRATDC